MRNDPADRIVAVYWDFENIHASLVERESGPNTYLRQRFQRQESLVNIKAVMDYARTIGVVAINRAYANWQWLDRYRDDLNEYGLDLIQQFSRGMKNGADIRLALDVLEDLHHFRHLTHIIVVGGDSDYISLAQKVKQAGHTIIGVGVRETVNQFWVQCCNEFKFYQTLLTTAGSPLNAPAPENVDRLSLSDVRALLLRALQQLSAQRGDSIILRSALKAFMLRLDPSFDEATLGFPSFSLFLDAFPDMVQNVNNDSGGSVRLIQPASNGNGISLGPVLSTAN
ncbi:MAG: NYN domain-containing protein, partial [Chloroflexota bacterium]|nr:NYN domain-containing protein [Chloroflexota bacterium]